MNWNSLKAGIAAIIKANGNQEITGTNMQNVLYAMVNGLGQNATFAGVATPSTVPGTPDGPVLYLAGQHGRYSNFGNVRFDTANAFGVFVWDGTQWHLNVVEFSISEDSDIIDGINAKIAGISRTVSSNVGTTTIGEDLNISGSLEALGGVNCGNVNCGDISCGNVEASAYLTDGGLNIVSELTDIELKIGGNEATSLQYTVGEKCIISNVNIGENISFEANAFRKKGTIDLTHLSAGGSVTIKNLRPINANDIVAVITDAADKVLSIERGADNNTYYEKSMILPQNAKYLYFLYYTDQYLPEPVFMPLPGLFERVEKLEDDITGVSNSINEVNQRMSEVSGMIKHYVPPTDAPLVNDGYINARGGISGTGSTYAHSNPIAVKAGDVITYIARGYKDNIAMICSCDSTGGNIRVLEIATVTEVATYRHSFTEDTFIILSANSAYEHKYSIEGKSRIESLEEVVYNGSETKIYHVGVGQEYPTLRSLLETIGYNESENNNVIYIHSNINLLNEYTEQELSTPLVSGYNWTGIYIPHKTKLVGVGNPIIELDWNNDTMTDNNRSLLNVWNDCCAEGITFSTNNMRYIVHQDCETSTFKTSVWKNCTFVMKKHTISGYSGSIYGVGVDDGCELRFERCNFVNYNNEKSTRMHIGGHLDATNHACSVIVSDCSFVGGYATFGFGGSERPIGTKCYITVNNSSFEAPILIGGTSAFQYNTFYRGSHNKNLIVAKKTTGEGSSSYPADWRKYCEINAERFFNTSKSISISHGDIVVSDGIGGIRKATSSDSVFFAGIALEDIPAGEYGLIQNYGCIPISIDANIGDSIYFNNGVLTKNSGGEKIGIVKYSFQEDLYMIIHL